MSDLNQLLENHIFSQVSLEEHMLLEVQRQLSHPHIDEYPDAKEMLVGIKSVLEQHFLRLNAVADSLAKQIATAGVNGQKDVESDIPRNSDGTRNRIRREWISQLLQDDYAALNIAAMGNTLLHTTALAANSEEIADIALEHLTNLTGFVVKLSELVPKVVVQELSQKYPGIHRTIGDTAAANAQRAWRGLADTRELVTNGTHLSK